MTKKNIPVQVVEEIEDEGAPNPELVSQALMMAVRWFEEREIAVMQAAPVAKESAS